jgi:hypothetical protein
MDNVTRFFATGFFHESVSPQHQSIPLGPFQKFLKTLEDIRKSRCTTGVNDTESIIVSTTPAANLPPVSTTSVANFATSFASVVDTGGK